MLTVYQKQKPTGALSLENDLCFLKSFDVVYYLLPLLAQLAMFYCTIFIFWILPMLKSPCITLI